MKSYELELGKEYVAENYLYKLTEDGLLIKKHSPSCWIKAKDVLCKDFTEYYQNCSLITWNEVILDEKVLVSEDGINWMKYHFAKCDDDGKIYVFDNGGTSWSTPRNNLLIFKFIKIADNL